MVDNIYIINADQEKVNSQILILRYKNQSVDELALDVKSIIGDDVKISRTKTNDNRSYHVSSQKISDVLGFIPKYSIKDAVSDLKKALKTKN